MTGRKFVRIIHEVELEITDEDQLRNYSLQMAEHIDTGEHVLLGDGSVEIEAVNAYSRFFSERARELGDAGVALTGGTMMHRVEDGEGRFIPVTLPAWAIRNAEGGHDLPMIPGGESDDL